MTSAGNPCSYPLHRQLVPPADGGGHVSRRAGAAAEVLAVFHRVLAACAVGWREGVHAGRSREKQV
jgi:hypothetical protein